MDWPKKITMFFINEIAKKNYASISVLNAQSKIYKLFYALKLQADGRF